MNRFMVVFIPSQNPLMSIIVMTFINETLASYSASSCTSRLQSDFSKAWEVFVWSILDLKTWNI